MKEYIIKLEPRSSFEVDLHSDTIFGAICWSIRTLFGEALLLKILEEFKVKPPFLISSAFPCRLDKEEYYIPKPFLKPLEHDELNIYLTGYKDSREIYHSSKKALIEIITKYKKFKKLRWLKLSYVQSLNKIDEKNLFRDYLNNIIKEPVFAEQGAVQKNSLDRLTGSTSGSGNTFYQEEKYFKSKWGLYFLVRTDRFKEELWPVLRLLEDSGIGSNARTGKNWFHIKFEEKPIYGNEEGDSFITLSRYIKNEHLRENCFYKLVSVRSKVESREEFAGENVWKNKVTYFSEGSMLYPEEKKDFYGGIFPVKEIAGKTIYQYGYAYPVWISREV